MHDGVYGRNHLYSYVNDNDTWWKTVDWDVTEASAIHLLLKGLAHVHPPCVSPIGFRRNSPDGSDRPPPRRRALHAHLQPRHSRREPRAPAMARRSCGTCHAPPFPFPFFFSHTNTQNWHFFFPCIAGRSAPQSDFPRKSRTG